MYRNTLKVKTRKAIIYFYFSKFVKINMEDVLQGKGRELTLKVVCLGQVQFLVLNF